MSLTNGALTRRNLSDVEEGKIVSFVYYGHGENYGQLRQATVLEVLSDGILAQEKNSGHPKHFKNVEAEDVKEEQNEVDFALTAVESQEDKNHDKEDCHDLILLSGAKGVTFVDAKQMLSEAGWAKEVVLDTLNSEQLVEVFGIYHTAVGDFEVGEISYAWDATNGNILIHDHRNPISVTSVNHDGMLKRVDFRITNSQTNECADLRVTVDQSGKVTLQNNGDVISAVSLSEIIWNLIKG